MRGTALAVGVWSCVALTTLGQSGAGADASERNAIATSIANAREMAGRREWDAAFRASFVSRLSALEVGVLRQLASQGETADLGPYIGYSVRPASNQDATSSQGAASQDATLGAMLGDSTQDLVFTPIAPCRVINSVAAPGPIVVPPGGSTTKTYIIRGGIALNPSFAAQGGIPCDVPTSAAAVSVNFTVAGPSQPGHVIVDPSHLAGGLTSTLNFSPAPAGLNLANGVITPLCDFAVSACATDIKVTVAFGTTHFLADITGYFAPPTPGPLPGTLDWANVTNKPAGFADGVDDVGTTGVTATSPLSSSGGVTPDISLTGIVPVANGGTGATTASAARGTLSAATAGANADITSLSALSTPLSVAQGGTAGATASSARTNLGAAASGVNADITALSGLLTALPVGEGGTGLANLTSNGVLYGQGTSAVATANGGAGTVLIGTAGAPGFSGSPSLTGSLTLVTSTATEGNIFKGADSFIHDYGLQNTFIGVKAGNFSTTGTNVTGAGYQALAANTTGFGNTANGRGALQANTIGNDNTAVGSFALSSNVDGNLNTAVGDASLSSNTNGITNTAVGRIALLSNTSGNDNVAVGYQTLANNQGNNNIGLGSLAGVLLTSGNNNIDIGNQGVAAESNTIRIGTNGVHTATYIAGTVNATLSGNASTATALQANPANCTGGVAAGIDAAGVAEGCVSVDTNNVANTLVLRDGSGSFSAGTITASLSGNASTATIAGNVSGVVGIANGGTGSPTQNFVDLTTAQTVGGDKSLTGNLSLAVSTPTQGNVLKGGLPFIHNFGVQNTFVGVDSGNFTMTGGNNTASGRNALQSNTIGDNNTASGSGALQSSTTGSANTASGASALLSNTTGGLNTATGKDALTSNTTGSGNTASGVTALSANTSGDNNTASGLTALLLNVSGTNNTAIGAGALQLNVFGDDNIGIGHNAGADLTTGSFNIDIGNRGTAAEGNTIRIGAANNQFKTFIAGIQGVTTDVNDAVAVLIDSSGQLGTISSSRRFKDDIADMAGSSDVLMKLRPVTFHYKSDKDPAGRRLQYGLIAEEVAELNPGLVARSADGQVETVLYQFLPPMLLNEVQKQQRTIEAQAAEIAALKQQTARIAELERQAARVDALLQRLSLADAGSR